MKKFYIFLLVGAPLVFLCYRIATRPQPGVFEARYTNSVSQWTNKTFISLRPMDIAAAELKTVPILGKDSLTSPQFNALTNAIVLWWKAYSEGNKETYLAFRFPPGMRWTWKDGALEKMSNYFVNGIIFDTDYLMEDWIRRYGSPERIKTFVPYQEVAKTWSREQESTVRKRWINKYGNSNRNNAQLHRTVPFEQWMEIAKNHSGGNWWSNYWTGVNLNEMVINVVVYKKPPEPLHKFDFGRPHKRSGYDADASFPNMGIGRMDRKSFIEWELAYSDLIEKQGQVVTANIYCMFRRNPPEYPQPSLLRLTYVNELAMWVPTEMANAHVMHGHKHTLYF